VDPFADHVPELDSLPETDPVYETLPLGAGQEPNANGGANSFQFARNVPILDRDSVQRNPDETFGWISRVPERP
jgi:hypothetical protein